MNLDINKRRKSVNSQIQGNLTVHSNNKWVKEGITKEIKKC